MSRALGNGAVANAGMRMSAGLPARETSRSSSDPSSSGLEVLVAVEAVVQRGHRPSRIPPEDGRFGHSAGQPATGQVWTGVLAYERCWYRRTSSTAAWSRSSPLSSTNRRQVAICQPAPLIPEMVRSSMMPR